jgi:hypothetical protein
MWPQTHGSFRSASMLYVCIQIMGICQCVDIFFLFFRRKLKLGQLKFVPPPQINIEIAHITGCVIFPLNVTYTVGS